MNHNYRNCVLCPEIINICGVPRSVCEILRAEEECSSRGWDMPILSKRRFNPCPIVNFTMRHHVVMEHRRQMETYHDRLDYVLDYYSNFQLKYRTCLMLAEREMCKTTLRTQ